MLLFLTTILERKCSIKCSENIRSKRINRRILQEKLKLFLFKLFQSNLVFYIIDIHVNINNKKI